jgi:parallel beta-helix repeat protein
VIDSSTFDHNGEMGLDANDSDGIIVERSMFYRNDTKNYPGYGEASGAKLLSTYGARIVGNVFRANTGMGLWFDRSSYNATVARNLFQENTWDGFKYEISARATVTENVAISNNRSGFLVYESSQVSLSHNYMRGNLIGIEVHEERRTLANTLSAHDSDHDRHMAPSITFDVRDVDTHENGFYYAPSHHTYAKCNPSSTVQFTLDGCQYQIAVEDDLAHRDAAALHITTGRDNFHLETWPSDPTHAPVPVFIAMWQARPADESGGGCVFGSTSTRRLRWPSLPSFQCTGQERGAATP